MQKSEITISYLQQNFRNLQKRENKSIDVKAEREREKERERGREESREGERENL